MNSHSTQSTPYEQWANHKHIAYAVHIPDAVPFATRLNPLPSSGSAASFVANQEAMAQRTIKVLPPMAFGIRSYPSNYLTYRPALAFYPKNRPQPRRTLDAAARTSRVRAVLPVADRPRRVVHAPHARLPRHDLRRPVQGRDQQRRWPPQRHQQRRPLARLDRRRRDDAAGLQRPVEEPRDGWRLRHRVVPTADQRAGRADFFRQSPLHGLDRRADDAVG
jgi:hypothetical protein